MTTLTFYGHSCFLLSNQSSSLLFDPFLTDSPWNKIQADEIHCNYILPSHAHYDHLGDTFKISKRTGAMVIATSEIAKLAAAEGCLSHGMHIGGKHSFDFGYVRITPAWHGSGIPGGQAAGFIVDFMGTIIYFAGDTGLFGDMALLSRLEKIDYALLPIGDNFTMGPSDALEAAKMLQARYVIPMHYNTWPLIAQFPHEFKKQTEAVCDSQVIVLDPGATLTLA